MDSGCVPPGDTFDAEFDVCRGLEATELIWIMDELLCLEIAWHDGYPLSQTVFTSLHIDRLLSPDNRSPYTFLYGERPAEDLLSKSRLVHLVLRAYCIALIKCCQLVMHTVQSQNFYEEEDFVTHLFGRELLQRLTADDTGKVLDNAIDYITVAGLPLDVTEALKSRLRFRKVYLAFLLGDATEWSILITQLEQSHQTHSLGQPLPEAFSEKVQRQLATSTPPRPMLQVPWDEAYTKWKKMCANIVEADRLTSFWVCQSPHCLQRATWAFAYREPQPNTFARAYIQDRLFGSDRITEDISHFDLLLTDIRDLVLAGDPLADPESFQVEMPSDPRHLCSRQIESFMDRVFEEYLNLYRMVCQNRCRIRRTFTQAIPLLDGMETIAMETDEELNRIAPQRTLPGKNGASARLNPLTSWAKYYKVFVMIRTIQLGFETDIYLPDELCTMQYLLSVFAHQQCSRLDHIERFLLERMKGLTKSRNTRYVAETLDSQEWLKSLHLLADVTRLMALALWRLCGILVAVKVIETPKRDYAQEQMLYDARMKPYLNISNDPIPSLEDIQRARKNIHSVSSTCISIEQDVKEAKSRLAVVKQMTPQQAKYVGTEEQWKREMKQLETTCVGIAVQTSQLLRIADKHGKKDAKDGESLKGLIEVSMPSPGKRYHDWWVVPQLKEGKI